MGQPHMRNRALRTEGLPLEHQEGRARRAAQPFRHLGTGGLRRVIERAAGEGGMAHQPFVRADALQIRLGDARRGGEADPAVLEGEGPRVGEVERAQVQRLRPVGQFQLGGERKGQGPRLAGDKPVGKRLAPSLDLVPDQRNRKLGTAQGRAGDPRPGAAAAVEPAIVGQRLQGPVHRGARAAELAGQVGLVGDQRAFGPFPRADAAQRLRLDVAPAHRHQIASASRVRHLR